MNDKMEPENVIGKSESRTQINLVDGERTTLNINSAVSVVIETAQGDKIEFTLAPRADFAVTVSKQVSAITKLDIHMLEDGLPIGPKLYIKEE